MRTCLICLQHLILQFLTGHVQNLHYKGFQHVQSDQVETGRLNVAFGSVKEFDHMRLLATDLTDCGIDKWWEEAMGFKQSER